MGIDVNVYIQYAYIERSVKQKSAYNDRWTMVTRYDENEFNKAFCML